MSLTAETCVLCHATGQLADSITMHNNASAISTARNFAKILSVTIPSTAPIKPRVVFTVRDAPGDAGNLVTGLRYFQFTVAQLVPPSAGSGGVSNWRSLINRNYNAASDPSIGGSTEPSLPPANFPAAKYATCTESAGVYTCDLANDLSAVQSLISDYGVTTVAFDKNLPTRIGLQSAAPNPGAAPTVLTYKAPPWPADRTYPPATITVQPTPPFNATFDLHEYDTTVSTRDPDPRALVATADCNKCHQRLTAHGRRLDVDYCVTCHNPYSLDNALPAAARNATGTYPGDVDFKRVIHALHMGKNLPGVKAGVPFTFQREDFSKVSFPIMTSNSTSDAGNCVACHALTGGASDNWKKLPTQVACAACHNRTSFVSPAPEGYTLHGGGPQPDDSLCAACHATGAAIAPVDKVHTGLPAIQAALTGKFQYKIVSVANTKPGQFPVVTFSVVDPTNANAPYTLTEPAWTQTANGASRLAVAIAFSTVPVLSGADVNFTNEGTGANPGQPISIDALAKKVAGTAAGTFTVTSTVAIPANAVGVGQALLEGHPANTAVTPAGRIPVKNAVLPFAITGTATTARRQVVSIDKCNACHANLTLHGNNRTSSIESCVTCHNANATDVNRRPKTGTPIDGKAEESIDFKKLIHGIHGASYSGEGVVIYGFGGRANDFREAGFPAKVNNCEVCHNPGTYSAAFAAAKGTTTGTATLADPSTYLRTTKITATCSSCHAAQVFTDHMLQMGGHFGLTQPQIDSIR